MTSLQLGGYDPLDAQLDDAAMAATPRTPRRVSRLRLAGWSSSSIPVASLLLVGIALGPRGISLLTPGALALLDPAVPVALAALGALVGLSIDVRRKDNKRPFLAAALESGLTIVLVATPFALLVPTGLTANAQPIWIIAGTLGLCAGSSLGVPSGNPAEPRTMLGRVMTLDVLLPIVAGGLVLGIVPKGATLAALTFIGQAAAIAVMLAAAGWLLLARAASDTEQRVFALATMLLIGGLADYLSLSALLSGLLAGIFWQLAGGQARESLRRDVLYIQHSLLVLVLVVAGARADFSLATSAIAVVYAGLRAAAKVLGGSLAGRIVNLGEARAFGLPFLSPGVFGVALALNMVRATGPDTTMLLTIVVLGTIGAELIAEIGRPREIAPPGAGEGQVSG
jgi:hypothetical protein